MSKGENMVERYKVVTGSETAHCCFQATVVDTARRGFGGDYNVCECLEREDAEAIARALNAALSQPNDEGEGK